MEMNHDPLFSTPPVEKKLSSSLFDVQAPPPELLLSAIIDSSDDAIISKSLDGVVTSWNRGAEHVFGYTFEEMRGHSGDILLPPGRESEEEGILKRVWLGERVDHFETVRKRKDGQLVDVSVT